MNAAYSAELVVRSLAAEVLVDPSFVVAEVADFGSVEHPIAAAAEAAAIAVEAVRTALVVGTGRLSTATASTVLAGYSPAAAVADSLAGPDTLADAVTALPDAELEAPSPWLYPLQKAYREKT